MRLNKNSRNATLVANVQRFQLIARATPNHITQQLFTNILITIKSFIKMENEQLTAAQMLEKAKANANFEFIATIDIVATTEHYSNNLTIILDRDIVGYDRTNTLIIKNSFHKNIVELVKQVKKSIPAIRQAEAVALVRGKAINPEVFLALHGAKIRCTKEFHAKGTPNLSGTTYDKDTYVTNIVAIEPHIDAAFEPIIKTAIMQPIDKVKPATGSVELDSLAV